MKPKRPAPALLLLWMASCSAVLGQNETYSTFSVFDGQEGRIFLNGFPMEEDDGTGDGNTGTVMLLNQLVIQGSNTLRAELTDRRDSVTDDPLPGIFKLRLERGPKADNARIEAFTVERETRNTEQEFEEMTRFSAENGFNGEVRGMPGTDHSLVTIDAAAKALDYGHHVTQSANVIEITFNATNVPLTTLPWTGAPVALTADDENDIRSLTTQLHTAFVNKDAPAALTLINNKTQRYAAALAVTVPVMEDNFTALWNLVFDDPAFTFAALDAPGLQFDSFPDANLVQITTADGSDPITGAGGGKEFAVPLFVSKLGGIWTIVD